MDESNNLPQEPQGQPRELPWKPNTYTPPILQTYTTEIPELILGLVILALSLVVVNGLLFAGPNLAFALGTVGIMAATFCYLRHRGHRIGTYPAALLTLTASIALSFSRSDDLTLKCLAICLLPLLPGLAYTLMAGKNKYNPGGILSLLDSFRTLFTLGFGGMGASGRGIRKAWSATGRLGKTGSAIGLGLLIAVPLLAVLIPLLMFADAAFEGLLDLLPELKWQELLLTLVLGTGLAFLLYTRTAALQHREEMPFRPHTPKGLSAITVNTVLCCVGLVYVVYLLSQLAYFVGGFSGILPEGYTLAQYARRGFFEMGWLCAINLGIISLSMGLVSARETPGRFIKILCLFLGIVTLFLVATASAKMLLYIRSYGLTRLRVVTEVFMLWLALTTVFVCVWLFRPKTGYMKPAVLAFLVLFSGLLWLDVDAQVAKYNVRAYQNGTLETVDVAHLAQLSDGAVPWLYELTTDDNPEVSTMARDVLRLRTEKAATVRSWNYASARAAEILRQFRAEDIGRTLGFDLTGCQATILKNTRNTRTEPLEYMAVIELNAEHRTMLEGDPLSSSWHSLALPMQLRAVLYGHSGAPDYRGPYFRDSNGEIQIPQIRSGKFFYLDRHRSANPTSWIPLHSDYEMHFTLAVWDADTNLLYFFMKDT